MGKKAGRSITQGKDSAVGTWSEYNFSTGGFASKKYSEETVRVNKGGLSIYCTDFKVGDKVSFLTNGKGMAIVRNPESSKELKKISRTSTSGVMLGSTKLVKDHDKLTPGMTRKLEPVEIDGKKGYRFSI